MKPAPLSADMFARAVIAAAVSYGDDPAHAMEIGRGANRRCLAPAVEGLANASRRQLQDVARILGFGNSNISRARASGGVAYTKARDAAFEAVTYHARTLDLIARGVVLAPEPKPLQTVSVAISPDVIVFTPKKSPRPERKAAPARAPGRQIARSATVEDLGGGVQVIRLKPVSDSIIRHAAAQAKRGVSVEDLADLFEVDAESLRRGLKAVGVEVAA